MDSATLPSAPSRMTALVKMSENQMKIKGGFSPVREEQILVTWRYLPVTLSQTRFKRVYYRTFPPTFFTGLPELLMEVTFIQKISIQLLTPENLFSLLPARHSARRASLPGVAESTHIILCAGLEGLAKETTFAITLASLFFMEFMVSVSTCFFFKNVWS